ncbi:sensor histidine kinase [Umezawaea sp.]|uniref:sensor histidine kinase n=1 Tax=Umezawaea sp. TaxID=1955258 RepID=UPI002ED1FA0A
MRTRAVDLLRAWTRPSGPPPAPTTRGRVFDVGLALVVGVVTVEYALNRGDAPKPHPSLLGSAVLVRDTPSDGRIWAAVLAALAALALVHRRGYPLAVLWAVLFAAVLTPEGTPRVVFYACVIAAYTAAAYSPYRVPTLAGVLVSVLVVGAFTDTDLPVVPNEYAPFLILVPIVVAANGMRTWKLRTEEGQARVLALERDRAEAERRAVEAERARIARELHDVVTHNVSVMVIQAGAARKVMDAAPDQAREALLAVEASGRATMSELRHVMGLLTPDADAPGELAPQPGLGELEALVARVRDAGLPVELAVSGERRSLPPGVELAAYRVVQEALTNTVKHASGASASVAVDYGADTLSVEVTDTGGTPSAAAATGNGRGLIGLRERLAVYGATLRSGPRLLGGYRVTALIPLEST